MTTARHYYRCRASDMWGNMKPPSDDEILREEYWSRVRKLASEIQQERAADFPIGGYPWENAVGDAIYRIKREEAP